MCTQCKISSLKVWVNFQLWRTGRKFYIDVRRGLDCRWDGDWLSAITTAGCQHYLHVLFAFAMLFPFSILLSIVSFLKHFRRAWEFSNTISTCLSAFTVVRTGRLLWDIPVYIHTVKKYNISANLIQVIKNLYNKATRAVFFNGRIGDWFRPTVEVRQGCLLATILFNIFLQRIMTDALQDHEGTVSIGCRTITNLRFLLMTLMA